MPTRLTRFRRTVLAVTVVGAAIVLPTAGAQGAAAAPLATDCTPQGTQQTPGGEYVIQNNEWNSTAQQCVSYTSGTAWSVSTANFALSTSGAPATYPSIYQGCHWGLCSTGSALPIQVAQLGSATTSWSTTQPGSGAYDVAYDLWFNSTPTTTGQPDGTEVMIWLNSRGGVQPFGSQTGTANVAGANWHVWTGQQTSWQIISYVLDPGGTSFTDLDVKALVDDAVARGSINPSNYFIDAEAGFEIWQGGQGLATNSFSFSATAGGGSTTDTQPPSTPTGLAVTGTTSSSASLSWQPSTDNVGVTGYDVYRGTTKVGTANGTTYTDTGLAAATAYGYTVRAHDAAGNTSSASSAVTATTAAGGGTGAGGCTATYAVTNQWNTGFTATVTVTNTGSAPTKSWQVGWVWPGNQQVTGIWNATGTSSGRSQSASSLDYNGVIAAGQSTSFGFQASYSGSNGAPSPTCAAG